MVGFIKHGQKVSYARQPRRRASEPDHLPDSRFVLSCLRWTKYVGASPKLSISCSSSVVAKYIVAARAARHDCSTIAWVASKVQQQAQWARGQVGQSKRWAGGLVGTLLPSVFWRTSPRVSGWLGHPRAKCGVPGRVRGVRCGWPGNWARSAKPRGCSKGKGRQTHATHLDARFAFVFVFASCSPPLLSRHLVGELQSRQAKQASSQATLLYRASNCPVRESSWTSPILSWGGGWFSHPTALLGPVTRVSTGQLASAAACWKRACCVCVRRKHFESSAPLLCLFSRYLAAVPGT